MFGLGLATGPTLAANSTIAGTGAVTGTVTASKPFTAAQVYLRNAEKGVTFMVYTAGGKYQAINLYPGDYEVTVGAARLRLRSAEDHRQGGRDAQRRISCSRTPIPTPKAGVNGPSTVVAYPGRATITDKDVEFVTATTTRSIRPDPAAKCSSGSACRATA